MTIIQFQNEDDERRATAFLLGRYSGRTWANGDWMVPLAALPALAAEGISFLVIGPPDFAGAHAPIRNSVTAAA